MFFLLFKFITVAYCYQCFWCIKMYIIWIGLHMFYCNVCPVSYEQIHGDGNGGLSVNKDYSRSTFCREFYLFRWSWTCHVTTFGQRWSHFDAGFPTAGLILLFSDIGLFISCRFQNSIRTTSCQFVTDLLATRRTILTCQDSFKKDVDLYSASCGPATSNALRVANKSATSWQQVGNFLVYREAAWKDV